MKNLKKLMGSFLILCVLTPGAFAQKLQVKDIDMPISKDAKKKGMYVNTTLTKDDNIRTFISYDLKKGALGFDVITLDPSGKIIENNSEVASAQSAAKYGIDIPSPGTVSNPGKGVNVLRLVTSNGILGKLKVQEGYFEPKYATSTEYGAYVTTYTRVLRGFKFQESKSTESDMRLNIYAAHSKKEDDLETTYNILEGLVPNTVGYYKKEAKFAFIGRDARWDKNSPNSYNVVVSGQFDGNSSSFINIKQTILEYNQTKVVDGHDGKGNRSVLVSALNSPSSVAAHKKFQAKGKPYMTYLTIDHQGNIQDNVTFESKSIRGNFGIYGFGDDHYILGSVNGKHTGYYRFDVGSATHFQIVKISNGKVSQQKIYNMDQMVNMAVAAGGKKAKLKYGDIKFTDCIQLKNGHLMAFAEAPKQTIIYQFDQEGGMKNVYLFPRVEAGGYQIETMESNNDIYVLQKAPVRRGIRKKISRGAGYMKNTTFSRIDEVMSYAMIVKINPSAGTCSDTVEFLPDLILGEDTIFKGSHGELILPIRDDKRNYRMVSIK